MTTDRPNGIDPQRLYAANTAAAAFYAQRLTHHPAAMRYLNEHGIAAAAQPDTPWQLGYSPSHGGLSLRFLRGGGFSDDELVAAGLARRHETGRVFATFRDRVMFPVHDEHRRIVGFTARNLGVAGPKYLNTPETAIYHKSKTLYGFGPLLHHPPPGHGQPLIVIVEGPTDALAVQQMTRAVAQASDAKPVYSVATCGTWLTSEHSALLARTMPTGADLALAFDGDASGRRALDRACPLVARWPGRRLGIELPDGHDPAALLAAAPDPAHAWRTFTAALQPLALIRQQHIIDDLLTSRRITDPKRYPQDRV